MRGAVIVTVFAAWYALLLVDEGGNSAARHFERAGSRFTGIVSQDSPVFPIASALADTQWALKRCPVEPDMIVAGRAGYHIVLENDWWDTDPDSSTTVPGIQETFAQLYLVAEDSRAPVLSPEKIEWRELPDADPEWMRAYGSFESVYMGTAGGYHIFGYMTVPLQEEIRQRLGTAGGEDRLQLLQRQLDREQTMLAYLKSIRLLVRHGDAAVPILQHEITRTEGSQRHAVIISLMRIPGPESARILRELYRQDGTHEEMAYLMRIGPYRPDLEDIHAEIRADAVK